MFHFNDGVEQVDGLSELLYNVQNNCTEQLKKWIMVKTYSIEYIKCMHMMIILPS